jgi:hypothetical protein
MWYSYPKELEPLDCRYWHSGTIFKSRHWKERARKKGIMEVKKESGVVKIETVERIWLFVWSRF